MLEKEIAGAEVELAPGGRGDFIVTADGSKLWDKRRMGDDFPEHDVMVKKARELV